MCVLYVWKYIFRLLGVTLCYTPLPCLRFVHAWGDLSVAQGFSLPSQNDSQLRDIPEVEMVEWWNYRFFQQLKRKCLRFSLMLKAYLHSVSLSAFYTCTNLICIYIFAYTLRFLSHIHKSQHTCKPEYTLAGSFMYLKIIYRFLHTHIQVEIQFHNSPYTLPNAIDAITAPYSCLLRLKKKLWEQWEWTKTVKLRWMN